MNKPDIIRSILRMHIAAIEAKYAIKILGILPQGSVGHMHDKDDALELLAEKQPGLTLLDLAGAEVDLGERLGRPVGIALVSGLRDREAEDLPRAAVPL